MLRLRWTDGPCLHQEQATSGSNQHASQPTAVVYSASQPTAAPAAVAAAAVASCPCAGV